jgi:hypothetical protein
VVLDAVPWKLSLSVSPFRSERSSASLKIFGRFLITAETLRLRIQKGIPRLHLLDLSTSLVLYGYGVNSLVL